MNQAVGLTVAAPVLLAFIGFMYRQGAMSPFGALTAAIMTVVIAVALFFS